MLIIARIVNFGNSIQSSTTPDQGYQWESDNFTIGHHKREPRGQSFPSLVTSDTRYTQTYILANSGDPDEPSHQDLHWLFNSFFIRIKFVHTE